MLSYRNLLLKTKLKKRKERHKSDTSNGKFLSQKQKYTPENQESASATPPEQLVAKPYKQIEEEAGDGNFRLKTPNLSVSYTVQPLGNLYFSPSSINSRNTGLGNLQTLTDDLILEILGLLNGTHLGVLSCVSKSFYVFCNLEPLWRNLVFESCKEGFLFNCSWKNTYIGGFASCGIEVKDFYSDYLFQSWLCANLEMKSEWLERDNIVRRKGISVEEFVLSFEEPNRPVLLEGCLDDWPAMVKWDREYLAKVCGGVKFSIGPVEMRLEDYFVYSDQAKEERPLYLFDSKFAAKVPQLGADYEVPAYFNEDLFSVLGDERPDYRWIIIGPAGSGSSFHIDPNSTSAWNAVIKGSKKWVLFPPDVVPPGVHPSPDGSEVACPVSIIEWFMNFYSHCKSWKKKPIECVCKAGEVIFVPNGWWHMVINLEDSIAITQNYVSRRNLLNVLDFVRRPNARTLVSGTRDRVHLHDKFKNAIESSLPGTIERLTTKAEEKNNRQKLSFWESATDSKAGAFKFSF